MLLGTDHKAVRIWLLGKGEQLSHPLGALTRAQSKVKQKQEMENNKATVNSGATIKPLDKMSPPKEAESESVSSSRDSPPMEVGASTSAEEEGGIVVEKGKDEEAKVLEPSDLEEEGSLAGNEGGRNSWFPTPSLVNSREEVASLVAQQQRDGSLKDSWRKAKDLYDRNTQPRQLESGELVLCHTPGLTSKLHGILEGPFEVLAKMSECNYVISVPGKRYT